MFGSFHEFSTTEGACSQGVLMVETGGLQSSTNVNFIVSALLTAKTKHILVRKFPSFGTRFFRGAVTVFVIRICMAKWLSKAELRNSFDDTYVVHV
jgi:hypothetical protein